MLRKGKDIAEKDLKKYYSIRQFMSSGDCILWKGKGIVSRLIRLYSKYSHASLVLRLTEFEGLKDRRFLLEALPSGIELRLLSERLKQYDGEAYWMKLKLDREDEKRTKIAEWGLKQVGKGYDYGSLFKNAVSKVNADGRRYFCSEYVYMAYREVGLVEEQKAPRPGDIVKWEDLFSAVSPYKIL